MLGSFFLTRAAELQDVLVVLQREIFCSDIGTGHGLVYIGNKEFFYQAIYHSHLEISRVHLLKLVTASNFINIVAPTGGIERDCHLLADAQRNGRSKVWVTVASVLYVWFIYWNTGAGCAGIG